MRQKSSDEIEDEYEGFEERDIEDDYFWTFKRVKYQLICKFNRS